MSFQGGIRLYTGHAFPYPVGVPFWGLGVWAGFRPLSVWSSWVLWASLARVSPLFLCSRALGLFFSCPAAAVRLTPVGCTGGVSSAARRGREKGEDGPVLTCGYLSRPKFFEKSAFFGFWASFRGWWAVGLWKIWELLGWRRCDLRRKGRTEGPTTPNRP